MKFPDQFLDELRAAVPVSAVVGRRYTLVRSGSELVAKEDRSVTVNDKKGLWYDFGKGTGTTGKDGGDHFKFLTDVEGLSFPEAVKTVASIAGIAVPGDRGAGYTNGHHAPAAVRGGGDERPEPPPEIYEAGPGSIGEGDEQGAVGSGGKSIDREYDYEGYQVVRFVWQDGGKKKKSFAQRRKAPDGRWIWGLNVADEDGPLEFMSKPGRDWTRYDKFKFEAWRYTERATFEQLGNIKHGFYKLTDVLEAIAEERTIFLAEGEKDVETLWDWGVPATTNSGGAKHFGDQDLDIFRDADIVLPLDNDKAGLERAAIVGRKLKGIAKRVRPLDFAKHWPGAPKGADVTDWRDQAGGTVEKLYEIARGLPDWTPPPSPSKFGRIDWCQQSAPRANPYEWWIKGVVPKRQSVGIIGPMSCGKSFESFNIGMHIATGTAYRGLRTHKGLVVFAAPEGGAGVVDRMAAYRTQHGLLADERIPFVALTRRFNLFASDADVGNLIEEVRAIAGDYSEELAMVLIDTFSAATTGMDENSSKDVSQVRARLVRIEKECNCTVAFVHHMNASGERQRGHSSITADVETVLKIEMQTTWIKEEKKFVAVLDDDRRPIRRLTNFKQREAEGGQHWDFVLKSIKLREDADGDPVTSCVSIMPARETPEAPAADKKRSREGPKGQGFKLYKDGEAEVFKAIISATAKHGEAPPPGARLPTGVRQVVRWSEVGIEYKTKVPNDEGETAEGRKLYADRVKKTLKRARKAFLDFELICIDEIKGEHPYHVVWPAGKQVWGQNLKWPDPDADRDDGPRPPDNGLEDFFDEVPE